MYKTITIIVFLSFVSPIFGQDTLKNRVADLESLVSQLHSQNLTLNDRVTQLESKVSTLNTLTDAQSEILSHITIEYLGTGGSTPDGDMEVVKTIRFTGVNVQIVNGLGVTNGNLNNPDSYTDYTVNGLGNLIVGYDEFRSSGGNNKSGSHNIVGGTKAWYSAFGSLVTGRQGKVTAPWAVVVGGNTNTADGVTSAVIGGDGNFATGLKAIVVGGRSNQSTYIWSTIVGGRNNVANGAKACIIGGQYNVATGNTSTINGGSKNRTTATGVLSSVMGGQTNYATTTMEIIGDRN